MKFTATALYYTGVTGEEVAHGQYTCDLQENEGRKMLLVLSLNRLFSKH